MANCRLKTDIWFKNFDLSCMIGALITGKEYDSADDCVITENCLC